MSPSVGEEWMKLTPDSVPNRLSAAASTQRSAAQNGQNSPPMWRTSGLPWAVGSATPLSGLSPVAGPGATVVNVPAGTLAPCAATRGSACAACGVTGGLDWLSFDT